MRKTLTGMNFSINRRQGRLTDLDFADDLALISHTHVAFQEMTRTLQKHGEKLGLQISHEKTNGTIIRQDQHHPPLTLGEHDIEYVENFTYLCSNISSTADIEKDVRTRIGKAVAECSNDSGTFGCPKPSLQSSGYTSTCQWSSQQQPTPARREQRLPASPTCWMSHNHLPGSHGETTSQTMR